MVFKDGEEASGNERNYSVVEWGVVILSNTIITRAKSTSSSGQFIKTAKTQYYLEQEKQPPKTEISAFVRINTITSLFPQTLFPLERGHVSLPLGLLSLKMVRSTCVLGLCQAVE